MAHIVDTSLAAVKISSFTTVEFSSSDEEGLAEEQDKDHDEENCTDVSVQLQVTRVSSVSIIRPRSNAILEPSTAVKKNRCDQFDCQNIAERTRALHSDQLSDSSLKTKYALSETESRSVERFTRNGKSTITTVCSHSDSHSARDFRDTPTTPVYVSQIQSDHTVKSNSDKNSYEDSHGSLGFVPSTKNNTHALLDLADSSPCVENRVLQKSSPVLMRRSNGGAMIDAPSCSSASLTTNSSESSGLGTDSHLRFNPFDRDMHMDEDHYSDNPDSNLFSQSSTSTKSAFSYQWGDQWNSDSEFVTNAELGLAEDHFSHPEGPFGMSHTEELELAIKKCKVLIQESPASSERHRGLVRKLVELRLRLQEMKDEPVIKEENVTVVLGHRLIRKESKSSKYYCEKCNSLIWGLVQEWRKCLDCGYRCHDKCVPQITRNCAMVKVKERPLFILELCPRNPKGLVAQDFRCAECRTKMQVADGIEPRLCEYNGRYYCELCHWNDLMYIPAEILHNWDFEKRKVCRASKQFLKLMTNKAVISVQDINPNLFTYVDQLSDIKTLREELLIMKKYIMACQTAMQAKLLLQLSGRPHFVECSDRYSLQDLLDSDESLVPDLVQVHAAWAQHIKTECQLCQGRGFVCELCKSREILFPFDNTAVICPSCSAVMHRICFAQHVICPRCERRRNRNSKEKSQQD